VREPGRLVDYLLDRVAGDGPAPVLFPASDAFVLFCSRHRDALSQRFRFALPSEEVLEALVDKRRQYELAERTGIPYPRAHYPETRADVDRVADEAEYPALVKPYYGHLWRQKFGGEHKGFKVESPDRLRAVFDDVLAAGVPAMVQSIVPGPNTNHYKLSAYVGRDGTPLALFGLQKVRQYPPEFGVGCLVQSAEVPEVTELGLRFLTGIGYRGIGSVEFKRDDRDGRLKLIELNCRLWQQNSLATACGINFPLLQLLDLNGEEVAPRTTYRSGVKWLDAIPDFQSWWAQRDSVGFAAWIASWRGTRAFSTFALDDPLPFLHENRYGGKYLRFPLYLYRSRRSSA
jgi:predicted ATP-grasp superfamily ATP-dependent carboligase